MCACLLCALIHCCTGVSLCVRSSCVRVCCVLCFTAVQAFFLFVRVSCVRVCCVPCFTAVVCGFVARAFLFFLLLAPCITGTRGCQVLVSTPLNFGWPRANPILVEARLLGSAHVLDERHDIVLVGRLFTVCALFLHCCEIFLRRRSPLVLYAAGKCSIRMKITDDKATMERRRFRIKVEATGRPDIEPALTDKLTVM